MKMTKTVFLIAAIVALFSISSLASAGQVIIPHSGILQPGETGKARTHYRILVPEGGYEEFNNYIAAHPEPYGLPPYAGYGYETPASLACVYKLVASPLAGCNPNTVTAVATGGSKAIALVDAYHYPYAVADLKTFSTQFGLPAPNLTVFNFGSSGNTDPYGWEVEEALDLQWAHAMAPNAKLYLVEAASSYDTDLLKAVDKAVSLVQAAGGGEISMSWGGDEWSGETSSTYESHFQTATVVSFASSGDSAGTSWPCVSPHVVCVGGTTLRRKADTFNFKQEVPWADAGGGISSYFARPTYQNVISLIVGGNRGVPDVSLAADPNTGGWVRYTPSNGDPAGWYIVGGTSWSSPAFAGIVNSAGHFSTGPSAEHNLIYSGLGTANFNDIQTGWCGPYEGYNALPGWDRCTGVGSDVGLAGK